MNRPVYVGVIMYKIEFELPPFSSLELDSLKNVKHFLKQGRGEGENQTGRRKKET